MCLFRLLETKAFAVREIMFILQKNLLANSVTEKITTPL